MGFQYSSLQSTEVTISGGLTVGIAKPTTDQTLITTYTTLAVNGTVYNLHTVTAGKTFYLMGVVYNNQSASGTSFTLLENDGTTIIFKVDNVAYSAKDIMSPSCPIASFAATTIVKGKAGGTNTTVMIYGYEE